jgi:hypothetical protein
MSFEYFIKNNFDILNILFHINENNLTIINNNTRIIKKDIYISNIFNSLPILKTLLEDILNEFILIETKIKESYNQNNNEFIYKIKFYNPKISHIKAFIKLKEINNKINISIDIINNNNCIISNKLTEDIIGNIIINYYKANFIEKDLKTFLENTNHHSFELNII